ncbi:hypothetical protein D3C73_1234310 [compost metagenome]
MGVDQCIDNFGLRLADQAAREALVVPWRAVGQDRPAERVGTVFVHDFPRVDDIAFGFGHLLAVLIEDVAVGDNRFVRRFALEQCRYGQQAVEPAAGLVDPFADHISRILVFKDLFILKRIVALRKRH